MKPTENSKLPEDRRRAFTLIELLTVVALLAVLFSLLLGAIASARKRSRIVVSTSNLHQISLALNMYLDDSDGKRPGLDELVRGDYLTANTLLCPEDKTGNWGALVQNTGAPIFIIGETQPGPATNRYSYLLHPLTWSEVEWNKLMAAGGDAGVAACQLHGLGNQAHPNVRSYSGLLLRAQRDGAVVRRQHFWAAIPMTNPSGIIPFGVGPTSLGGSPSTLRIYLDDPNAW